ncbi:MAG: bifunctional phosphoribosylaminoimidazolecarboxamide formyltransferase/IMP cyclohydrolase [Defluviitaleaceae bacterium]|nr:bifunctional phosphoribosylaminoimidazolecarboxamide formyltransferase/IMP cyclohydrolase [Defluviitaleaceae bacterium]
MKYALISVSDKTHVTILAHDLVKIGYTVISTGGTATTLTAAGIAVTSIEDITQFPECMDGRLKTLHPRISGGLLGVRDNPEHASTMTEHKIPAIDILVVNLYPFKATISKPNHTLEEAIENIDIGGPTMIRAGAKNHKFVAVVTNPADYEELVHRAAKDKLDEDYRYRLAAKAFRHTAAYDAHISRYLSPEAFPDDLTLTFRKHSDMRYGENPHQAAAYYVGDSQGSIENAQIIHGKALSFNNIADAHAAVALVREFPDQPVCVAVKHATPCGVAVGNSIFEAYIATYMCDPTSIFGGIVAFNREVDKNTALKMNDIFLEVIIAPAFSPEALKVLTTKKNLRLLVLPALSNATNADSAPALEFKSVGGGLLIQESDASDISKEDHTVVTKNAPSQAAMADLVFGMKVVKHVKSNAIVVVKDGCLLGQGGGEVSRIWAAQAALSRAGERVKGAVLASDALFPFPDVVEACAEAGITAIIQPGGSKNDQASIDACNAHGIAMVFTGVRHFKH